MLLEKLKTVFPVSLVDAKKQLRVDSDFIDDNSFVQDLIKTATIMAENFIEKDIAYTKNTYTQYDFSGSSITINEGNYLSLTSITLATGSTITEDYIETFNNYFKIYLKSGISSDPLKVVYYAGYSDGNCPRDIQQAIKMKIVDLYDTERGDYSFNSVKNNRVFDTILNYHKIIRF